MALTVGWTLASELRAMPNNHCLKWHHLIMALALCALPVATCMAADAATTAPASAPQEEAPPAKDAPAPPASRGASAPAGEASTKSADTFDPSESISEDATVPYPVDI